MKSILPAPHLRLVRQNLKLSRTTIHPLIVTKVYRKTILEENDDNLPNMEADKLCFLCQDYELNVGHQAKWCPKLVCLKCGQKGHSKVNCMWKLENLPLPNEILLKIFSYLRVEDLDRCSQVSKRVHEIITRRKEIHKPWSYKESILIFYSSVKMYLFHANLS